MSGCYSFFRAKLKLPKVIRKKMFFKKSFEIFSKLSARKLFGHSLLRTIKLFNSTILPGANPATVDYNTSYNTKNHLL
jgi:hypothetical protein